MNGDTSPKELDRDHQQTFLGIASDDDPLHVRERPAGDAHALPTAQIGMRHHRGATRDDLPDRFDLRVRDDGELVPAIAENAHEPAGPAQREIARFVDRMTKEDIPAEEGNARQPSNATTSAPRLDRGKEGGEPERGELIMDDLLAIAARPENVPALRHGFGVGVCQGFAPFGLFPVRRGRPTIVQHVCRVARPLELHVPLRRRPLASAGSDASPAPVATVGEEALHDAFRWRAAVRAACGVPGGVAVVE